MAGGLGFALFCAIAAILYGVISSKWILGLSTGSEKMQKHRRRHSGRCIGLPETSIHCHCLGRRSAVRRHPLCFPLADCCGLRHRRTPLRFDRFHRHERLGARQRAHRRSCQARVLTRRLMLHSRVVRSLACWWWVWVCSE